MKLAIAVLTIAAAISTTSANAYDFRTDSNSPKIYAPNGQYLGNLNNNQYDPNSIANPYGQYGNKYSPNSVNNQFGQYGNQYSPNYSNPYGRKN